MNQREQAQYNRKVAKRVLLRLTGKGQIVGRNAWVKETEKEASCTDDMAYNAVQYVIDHDSQVGTKPKKGGRDQLVYFYSGSAVSSPKSAAGGRMQTAIQAALEILRREGGVMTRKELLEEVWRKIEGLPSDNRPVNKNASNSAVDTQVLNVDGRQTHGIEQVGHGLYKAMAKKGMMMSAAPPLVKKRTPPKSVGRKRAAKAPPKVGEYLDEKEFYEPFARHMQHGLSECDIAVELGGAHTQLKWANPDVVGSSRPSSALTQFNFPTQIVVAEVKTGKRANRPEQRTIEAFGQACAYTAFAHKVYVVVPKAEHSSQGDIGRLETLCNSFGIGLCLFDPTDIGTDFEIRVRARSHQPDPVYVKLFLKNLQEDVKAKLGFA